MPPLPKVTVIHGDYQKVSREFFDQTVQSAKNKGLSEIVRLDGSTLDLTQLVQACESSSFLESSRLVVIDSLYQNRSKTIIKMVTSYISEILKKGSSHPTNPLVIWAARLLTPAELKPFSGASIKVFRLPSTIFKFLENLAPDKQAVFIPQYQHLIKTEPADALLVLIARQIRLLIQVSDPNFKLPPWQLNKFISQRRLFTEDQLISFHDGLVALDHRAKSGKLVGDLAEELLMLLMKL